MSGLTSHKVDAALTVGLHFVVLVAVFNQGLFYRDQFVPILGLTFVLTLAALLSHPTRARLLLVAVPLLITTLVTAQLAGVHLLSRPTVGGILIFGFVIVVAQSPSPASLRRILISAALLTTGFAWLGVAFRVTPYGRIAQNLWRGSSSITYSNAAAVVIAVGLLVAINQQRQKPSLLNGLQVAALLVGFASTQSRAGAIALVVALLVFGIGSRCRGCAHLIGPFIGGLIGGAAIVLTSPVTQAQRPAVAIAGIVLGACVTIVLQRFPRLRWPALGISVIAGVALAIGPASTARQEVAGVRLAVTSEDRAHEWEAAADIFGDNLWTGVGPGNAPLIWQDDTGRFFQAEYAHNEYLQLAAEQGLLGLFGLMATAGLIWFFWVRRPDLDMAAATVLILLHAAFDFLAHIPVVLIVLAIVVAMPMNRKEESRSDTVLGHDIQPVLD